jgi:hypothetical protein
LREQILRERPGIKVLLMSGTGSHLPIKEVPFLRKPFQVEELKTHVRHLVGSAGVRGQVSIVGLQVGRRFRLLHLTAQRGV